jgi:hypothetical protein
VNWLPRWSRYFAGIDSTAKAREYARTIAGWKPLPKLPRVQRMTREKSRGTAEE